MNIWNKFYKRVCSLPKKRRDISDTEVYKVYKETGIVDYDPMIDELMKRTHLSKDVVTKVYETEGDILYDLGIIKD